MTKPPETVMQSYPQTVISDQELRQVYLFAGLNEHQIKRVKQSMRTIRLEEGDILFEQEQQAQRFFLLKSGYVKLLRLSLEGTEKVFEIISPEQTFAEAIMFMPNSVYPVTAQAIDCSTLLAFENQIFLDILKESSDTCFRLMFHMSRRIRKWVNEVDNLTLQNATYRLINYLLYLIPPDQTQSYQLQLPIPKQVIASRLSIKPETFSRILHALSQQGLLTVTGRTISIHDVDQFRQYSQSEFVSIERYQVACRGNN